MARRGRSKNRSSSRNSKRSRTLVDVARDYTGRLGAAAGGTFGSAVGGPAGGAFGAAAGRWAGRAAFNRAGAAFRARSAPPLVAPQRRRQANRKTSYNTRGHLGRIRTTRSISKSNDFQKYGTVGNVEIGGTLNDDEVVYVGHHTTPPVEMIKAFCRAIMRRVAQDGKMDFTAFSSAVDLFPFTANTMEWFIEYNLGAAGGGSTVIQTPILITAAFPDYEFLSAQLAQWLWAIVDNNEKIEIRKISLRSTAVTPRTILSEIRGKDVSVKFYCSSKLAIQNRTVASNAVDNVESTNVANNPLVGFAYEGPGNCMRPRTNNSDTTFSSSIANMKQGLLTTSSAQLGPATGPTDVYKKPLPPNSFANVKKSAKFTLTPGQIKTSFIKSSMHMPMNTFLAKMYDSLSAYTVVPASSDRKVLTMGKFKAHSMEKYLDSRLTANPVSIAYQLDLKICCRLSVRKYCIGVPSNTVSTTAGPGP